MRERERLQLESGKQNELNQYLIHQCCNDFHKHWKSAISVQRERVNRVRDIALLPESYETQFLVCHRLERFHFHLELSKRVLIHNHSKVLNPLILFYFTFLLFFLHREKRKNVEPRDLGLLPLSWTLS